MIRRVLKETFGYQAQLEDGAKTWRRVEMIMSIGKELAVQGRSLYRPNRACCLPSNVTVVKSHSVPALSSFEKF